MTIEILPNKTVRSSIVEGKDLWPEFGEAFELNGFYRKYETAEGEIGESYIQLWTASEIDEYDAISSYMFSKENKLFASDGGGTYFGFKNSDSGVLFFSCDPIDLDGSINILGSWSDFIRSLESGDY